MKITLDTDFETIQIDDKVFELKYLRKRWRMARPTEEEKMTVGRVVLDSLLPYAVRLFEAKLTSNAEESQSVWKIRLDKEEMTTLETQLHLSIQHILESKI